MADLQTKLSYFLSDLYAGTLGVLTTITSFVATAVSSRSYALSGAVGQTATISTVTVAHTTNSGLITSTTAATLIPANCIVLGVTAKVTTIIAGAGGIATFSVGDGTDADRWGAGIAKAANTTTNVSDFTIASPVYYGAATNIVLTANAGQFDSGVVRLCVHYIALTGPTS